MRLSRVETCLCSYVALGLVLAGFVFALANSAVAQGTEVPVPRAAPLAALRAAELRVP